MGIRVCIVDDEPLAINEMEMLLGENGGIEICGKATNAMEAIELVNKEKPDVVFLDIQLKEINAFSILEKLKVNTHIVFVTAYDKFATRAFEVNALDYLLKPVHPLRLKETLERYKSNTNFQRPKELTYKYADRIIISEKNEYKLIIIKDILFISSDGDYTTIHLNNDKKKLILKSMNDWEKLLPNEHFARIHRATIINLEYIERIEKGFNNTCKVYLEKLPQSLQMSQRYTVKFLSKYKA